MSVFRAIVGIDPSGNRLALAALRTGLGGPLFAAAPSVSVLRGDRGATPSDEAEAILSDFVARNGLAGSAARLYVPAREVYTARVSFPALKDRDLRQALELELERLFPFSAAKLRFAWRKVPDGGGEKRIGLVVAATPAEYVDRWADCVARAGLVLSGAIPAGWALASACAKIGLPPPDGLSALVRNAGGAAEATVFSTGEPVFCAARGCPPEAMPRQALGLAEEGLPDAAGGPEGDGAVALYAPTAWSVDGPQGEGGVSWRAESGFEARAREMFFGDDRTGDPWDLVGAFGAAAGERTVDLLAPSETGSSFPWAATAVAALAAATVVLALAWPATVAWKAKGELRALDARIAALQPAVARVQDELNDVEDIDARTAVLREAGSGRDEPIEIVRLLTERLPQGTWLTGLRFENRKVEMDGLSPAASEIFSLLTRDGRFRGVEFAAPITRQGDNLERFQIRAEYVPPAAPAGPGAAR